MRHDIALLATSSATCDLPGLPKRTLTAEERQIIHEALKDDMAALQRVYGFEVGKWGFSAG